MEIKKTISEYSYRIDPKPGGGFVAHSTDSSMETLEGTTKEEIVQKIQEKIDATIAKDFPGVEKLPHADPRVYRIEAKPGGGFVALPPSSSMQQIEGATKEEVLQKIEESLGAIASKVDPADAKFVHADFNIGGLHISVDKKLKMSNSTSPDDGQTQQSASRPTWSQPSFSQSRFSSSSSPQANGSMGPILPGEQSSGLAWRIIATLIFLGVIVYFLLRH